jgi:hypothetical protein
MMPLAARINPLQTAVVLVSLLVVASGCDMLNPNRQILARISTRLIAPSPDVERLLWEQRVEDTKVERFWQEGHGKQEELTASSK